MNLVFLLLALISIYATGAGLLALLARGSSLSRVEGVAWAWWLGSAGHSAVLFLLSNVLTGRALVVATGCVSLLIFSIGWQRGKRELFRRPWLPAGVVCRGWAAPVVLAVIWVGASLVVFRLALMWDGLFIWEFKARTAFLFGGRLTQEVLQADQLGVVIPNYPLGFSSTILWIYLCIGGVDQTFARVPTCLALFSGILGLWTAFCRVTHHPWIAVFWTVLFFFCPLVLVHGSTISRGYVDLCVGFIYLGAVVLIIAPHPDGGTEHVPWRLVLAASAMLPWFKDEGIFFVIVLASMAAVFAIGRERWHALRVLIAGGAVFAGWHGWCYYAGVPANTSFVWPEGGLDAILDRGPLVLYGTFRCLTKASTWGGIWYLVLLSVIPVWLVQPQRRAAWTLATALPLFFILAPFFFTSHPLHWHLATATDRLALQVLPTAWLGLGLAASPWRKRFVPRGEDRSRGEACQET